MPLPTTRPEDEPVTRAPEKMPLTSLPPAAEEAALKAAAQCVEMDLQAWALAATFGKRGFAVRPQDKDSQRAECVGFVIKDVEEATGHKLPAAERTKFVNEAWKKGGRGTGN